MRRSRPAARRREPVRRGQHPLMHHLNAALRAHAHLPARRRIHRARRRSDHRRRVHRPHDAGPALVRRPAPGGRGEGRRAGPAREPDVAIDHVPELFRLYKKLSGMTGTADTEALEFQQIYGLEVVVIPTHRPMVRKDHPDFVYLNAAGQVQRDHRGHQGLRTQRGQPVLVGTTSIETSELLSEQLLQGRHRRTKCSTPSSTSARRTSSRRPACPARVTIATNMAGRGTDIVLGGILEAELEQLPEAAGERRRRRASALQGRMAGAPRRGAWPPAACTSSAPNATNRAASTTSCAAAPAARAIRVRAASTCRWKTT